jgi:hypothetical protein
MSRQLKRPGMGKRPSDLFADEVVHEGVVSEQVDSGVMFVGRLRKEEPSMPKLK